MKVYLGTDHAGFHLKEALKGFLQQEGYEVEDCGAFSFEKQDDYTTFIPLVAKNVSEHPDTKGIILGGSGQAEAMLANKFPNIRAAVFYGPVPPKEPIEIEGTASSDEFAIIGLTRAHNDANILSLGERFLTEEQAKKAVDLWLKTSFSNAERHVRRIEKMAEIASEL